MLYYLNVNGWKDLGRNISLRRAICDRRCKHTVFSVEKLWDYNVGINSTQCCDFPRVQNSCQSPWMNGDICWICCCPAITMATTHATVHIHAHHWPLLIGFQIWPGVTWSIYCLNGWALDILSTYCRLCHVTCRCLRRISTTRVCWEPWLRDGKGCFTTSILFKRCATRI